MNSSFGKTNALVLGLAFALGVSGSGLVMAQTDMNQTQDSEQPVTDTWITTKVKSELATTDGVKSTDISVTTKNGEVILTGALASKTAVDKAVAATKSIKGVRGVDASGLKVAAMSSSEHSTSMDDDSDQPVTDTWITTKVKSELAVTDGVKSTDISVTTTNGDVVLTGALASKTAVDKAVAATKSIKGVHNVDSSGLKVSAALADNSSSADADSDQPVADTWITTKVKADLATTDGVKSGDISVETTNGEVVLIGVLESKTAVEKAVAVTRSIKGVRNVDSSGLKVR